MDMKQQRHKGAQEVLAALSFLEVEERQGRINLDATEFRYVVSRLCELGRLDPDEVPIPAALQTCRHKRLTASIAGHASVWRLSWDACSWPGATHWMQTRQRTCLSPGMACRLWKA